MRKYRQVCRIFRTEEEAKAYCDGVNKAYTPYASNIYSAKYTRYASCNGKLFGFIVCYMSNQGENTYVCD